MEDPEPVPAQDQDSIAPRTPPEQAQGPAPDQAPAPAPTPSPEQPQSPPPSKKRRLEPNPSIQQSKYFKMRSVLKDLRPHFIEVLKMPNFRECKAAEEIRENVKILMDLYRQMVTETTFMGKCTSVPEGSTTTGEARESQKVQDVKPPEPHRPEQQTIAKLPENKQQTENTNEQSMVGGSAFGWNFVTFPDNESKPVYYGITKESFRSGQVNLQEP